jgi:hypothetical protein
MFPAHHATPRITRTDTVWLEALTQYLIAASPEDL